MHLGSPWDLDFQTLWENTAIIIVSDAVFTLSVQVKRAQEMV